MPLYDFQCKNPKCKKTFEILCCINDLKDVKIKQKCPHCLSSSKILVNGTGRDWFKPHINEDFDGTPILVESKRHYKELCKKHGVISKALMGG